MSKHHIEKNTKTAEKLTESINTDTFSAKNGTSARQTKGRPLGSQSASTLDGCEVLMADLLKRGYSLVKQHKMFNTTYRKLQWFVRKKRITPAYSGIALKDLLTQSGIEV